MRAKYLAVALAAGAPDEHHGVAEQREQRQEPDGDAQRGVSHQVGAGGELVGLRVAHRRPRRAAPRQTAEAKLVRPPTHTKTHGALACIDWLSMVQKALV